MDLLQAKNRLAAAIELRNTSQLRQATESFFSLVKDLDGATDPDVRKVLAEATVNLGYLIAEDGNAAFAIAVFDRVITQLPEVGYFAVHATVAKADLLREGGHSTEATAYYEQARDSARSRIDELPELASLLGSALMQLGLLYAAEGRPDDAVAAYDEIVARFPQPAGGVRWEIDAVQRCSATERTLVVLSPPVEVEGPQAIAMAYYGADPSPGQPVTKDSPELAPFHRVIQDAELTGDVSGKPWVSDLLVGIQDIRALPPEARPRWDGVAF